MRLRSRPRLGSRAGGVVVLAVAIATVVPAPGAEGAASGVVIQDSSYIPSPVTVQVGDTVTWTHHDDTTPHSVTADDGSFDSSPTCTATLTLNCMHEGASFQHTFTQTGTFPYHCKVHSTMHGVVQVESASASTTSSSAPPTTSTTAKPVTTTAAAAPTTVPRPATTPVPTTGTVELQQQGGGPRIGGKTTSSGSDAANVAVIVLLLVLALGLGGNLLWRFRPERWRAAANGPSSDAGGPNQ